MFECNTRVVFSASRERSHREEFADAQRLHLLSAQVAAGRLPVELHSNGLQVVPRLPARDQRDASGEGANGTHPPAVDVLLGENTATVRYGCQYKEEFVRRRRPVGAIIKNNKYSRRCWILT